MTHQMSPKRQALAKYKQAYNAYLDREITYDDLCTARDEVLMTDGVKPKNLEAVKDQVLLDRKKHMSCA